MEFCINCGLYKNDPDLDLDFCPAATPMVTLEGSHWFMTEEEYGVPEEFREDYEEFQQ